jgi:PncC family amidohydrolase
VRATATRAVGTAGIDGGDPEHLIARRLREHGWTLSVAESITGGGVGARLVTVPGASEWFAGGVIVYATPAKSLLAGVPHDLLGQQGPVSEDVAVALAVGVRRRLETDVGLAVVGVAGPTTQGGRAVGTVCVGVALADGTRHAETTVVPALARTAVQQRSATVALDVLCRRLAGVTVGG